MRAILWAIAVIALGAPSLARRRRKQAPSADSLLNRELAARRNAFAMRLPFLAVLLFRTLPPLISRLGQSFSQLANAEALRNELRSGPTSERNTWMNWTLIPSTSV